MLWIISLAGIMLILNLLVRMVGWVLVIVILVFIDSCLKIMAWFLAGVQWILPLLMFI